MSSIREKVFYSGDDAANAAIRLIISTLQNTKDTIGNNLFDSVEEGNATDSNEIYSESNGVCCRVYRISGSFTDIVSVDKWLFRRWIPIFICPIFNLKVDSSKKEFIEDYRDNIRTMTIRALSQPKFNPPNSNAATNFYGGWQFLPIAKCNDQMANLLMKFETNYKIEKSDWYSAGFSTTILVDCR